MSEERLRDVELEQAALKTKVDGLEKAIEANTVAVTKLTESLNQSKGALWVLGGLGTLAAGVIGYFHK